MPSLSPDYIKVLWMFCALNKTGFDGGCHVDSISLLTALKHQGARAEC